MKYRIRKGLIINSFPVTHSQMILALPTKNKVQKHEMRSLKRSIKVECLIIPAYVLKIYINMTFENITPANIIILSL
jgi:hypothetical protein